MASDALANLSVAVRLADRSYVYDNSLDGIEARLCVRTQEGLLRKICGDLLEWVADATRSLGRHPGFIDMRAA